MYNLPFQNAIFILKIQIWNRLRQQSLKFLKKWTPK